jgi:hypothetical protein
MKHRERTIRFAAKSCGYSSQRRRVWAAADAPSDYRLFSDHFSEDEKISVV